VTCGVVIHWVIASFSYDRINKTKQNIHCHTLAHTHVHSHTHTFHSMLATAPPFGQNKVEQSRG
jgi:hypothetical protein